MSNYTTQRFNRIQNFVHLRGLSNNPNYSQYALALDKAADNYIAAMKALEDEVNRVEVALSRIDSYWDGYAAACEYYM